jgi:hypothetical protein
MMPGAEHGSNPSPFFPILSRPKGEISSSTKNVEDMKGKIVNLRSVKAQRGNSNKHEDVNWGMHIWADPI